MRRIRRAVRRERHAPARRAGDQLRREDAVNRADTARGVRVRGVRDRGVPVRAVRVSQVPARVSGPRCPVSETPRSMDTWSMDARSPGPEVSVGGSPLPSWRCQPPRRVMADRSCRPALADDRARHDEVTERALSPDGGVNDEVPTLGEENCAVDERGASSAVDRVWSEPAGGPLPGRVAGGQSPQVRPRTVLRPSSYAGVCSVMPRSPGSGLVGSPRPDGRSRRAHRLRDPDLHP